MKKKLIEQEMQCIFDCVNLAQVSIAQHNIRHTKMLLEDAIKSVNEVERLMKDETVVLVGTRLYGGNSDS